MSFQKALFLLAACSATAFAQSSNTGLGTNPEAQGATEEVTPGTGPNGYAVYTTLPLRTDIPSDPRTG